jgi:dienelactone hydrolase
MRQLAALAAAALLLSCGDAKTPPAPSAVARFAPSDGVMDWGDVPFPSELYRESSGSVRLGALPTPQSDAPLLVALRELLATRDGFCATCNVYFVVDGELDAAQIATLGGPPSAADPVLLADVDPASSERGRLLPLRVQWDAENRVLALRPERGVALQRSRRYAAALTSVLRAADGTPLGASDVFRGAASGDGSRAAGVLAPALDELERIGIAREDVVALAPFVTEDVTADLVGARSALQGGTALAVSVTRVRTGGEIDELLGVPSVDRPGIDVPPDAGSDGTRSIAHGTIAEVITGVFEAPRLVEGSGTDIGIVRRDRDGTIVAGPREAVPFVLTIPVGVAREGLPVAIAHHGFNASRTTGFATAETAARAGVAVLAIDAFQHGDRAASARDELHAIRGEVPGADGFAETTPADVSARIFGIAGAAPGLEGFPGYSHASLLQFAADVMSTVRLVREGALDAALSEASPGGSVDLDATRIGFIGNSLGSVVGMSALAAEPELRAAVQNVAPGSIVETLVESPEFRPLVEVLFLPRLGLEPAAYDEVRRQLILDPIVDLTRWVLEPVDPLALAPYLLRERVVAGIPPEVLFQVAALDEVASVLATESMLAATGASRVTRYDPAAHGMLEVLEQASRYEPPAAPPYRLRPAPIAVLNPIVEQHEEIEEFLARVLVGN